MFLTRLPVPAALASRTHGEADFRRSAAFFPAAGLVVGLLLALAGWLLARLLPPGVAAVLLAAVWIGLSGALHMDGLMDTADGLLSHRSRERMLEIMKDSRVGAMGVVAGVLSALLRVSLLAYLLARHEAFVTVVLATIPVWSRAFLTTAIAAWPYARTGSGGGLGALFRAVGAKTAAVSASLALAMTIAALAAAGVGGASFPADPVRAALFALVALGVTFTVGWLLASAVSRKLGGLTGDVYGALNECIELALLLAAVAYLYNAVA